MVADTANEAVNVLIYNYYKPTAVSPRMGAGHCHGCFGSMPGIRLFNRHHVIACLAVLIANVAIPLLADGASFPRVWRLLQGPVRQN